MRKLIALLCVAAMLMGVLAGCVGEDDPKTSGYATMNGTATNIPVDPSTLDYVEMDWYIPIPLTPDLDMVEDKMNEYLKEKLNLKLNFVDYTLADYPSAVPTVLRAGKPVGIATIYGMNYQVLASEGALYPLDELLVNYGEATRALYKDEIWNGLRYDGEIFMVPTFKDNANIMGYIYNKTMADDLGIDMSEFDTNVSVMDDEEFLMDVLAKRNAKYPDQAGVPLVNNATSTAYFFNVVTFGTKEYIAANYKNNPAFAGYDDKTVFNMFATEEYRQLCLLRQRLCEAGVIAWDYKAGGYSAKTSFLIPSWGYVKISDHQYRDDWESVLVKFDTVWGSLSSYTVAGTAIPVNCPDPERAMMFIELLNSDPYLGTLLHFGIQDVHWKLDETGDMVFEGTRNEDKTARGYYQWYGMGFGAVTNLEHAPKEVVGEDGYLIKELQKANANADMPTYISFVFNPDPVANEIAACNNVVAEYNGELMAGHYDSAEEVEAALKAFNDKLIANGVQKIIDECQRQMDEHAASLNG